jgi:uncharacterized membrane protein
MEDELRRGCPPGSRELLETNAAGLFSFVLFVLALACSVLSGYVMLRTGRPVRQAFADMRMQSDTFMRLCTGGYALWSLAALAALSIVKEALARPARFRLLVNALHLVVVLTITWLYVLGLLEPVLALFEQIGQG